MKLTIAILALTATAAAQISGSPHDFSNNTANPWNTAPTNELCGVCHAPHKANVDAGNTVTPLLWSREGTGNATFTPYTSATMPSGVQPGPSSLLCLSCHDGSVDLENFGNTSGTTGTTINTLYQVGAGGDMSREHPVGVTYPTGTYALGGFRDPAIAPAGQQQYPAAIDTYLKAGDVECATCHDVHDELGQGSASFLLWVPNTNSALCLSCHWK